MTLSFLRWGESAAGCGPVISQLNFGSLIGVMIMSALIRPRLADPAVKICGLRLPGQFGVIAAWLGEFAIAS